MSNARNLANLLNSSGVLTADAGLKADNITIDGTEIDLSSGDLTVDSAGDIILDADGADVSFRDGGTGHLSISNSSNDAVITSLQTDKDMIFKGVDGGSLITAFTLDMSDGGKAIFRNGITLSDGDLNVASGHGISFGQTTTSASGASAATTTLREYEEGTWTPVLAYATGGTTGIAYTTQVGRYTKVGNIVSIYFRIVLSNKGSGSGNASLSGLPFPVANVTQYPAAYGLHHDVNSGSGNSVANVLPIAQLFNNTSGLFWFNADSTTEITADYFNNNSVVNGNVVYETS